MYIRKTTKISKGKTYTHYLLVESVHTPKGPRQRTICALGRLAPGPLEQWYALAHKVEAALAGQLSLAPQAPPLEPMVEEARIGPRLPADQDEPLDPQRIVLEEAREAGPVHVGHQMWHQLGLSAILHRAGLSAWACLLSEVMTLNRLISPLSEHAMPDWFRRTALGDILGAEFATLTEDALYRNLDRLHPHREQIERELAAREQELFHLDETIYLYDLTSTYFEGQAVRNRQARRGYSRDKRPDCKQVLVGLVLDRDGFPKAHEIFEGNRHRPQYSLRDAHEAEETHGQDGWGDRRRRPWHGVRGKPGPDSGAGVALHGGGPAGGAQRVVGRVRGRRLGRSAPDSLSAQPVSAQVAGADQAPAAGQRRLHSVSE